MIAAVEESSKDDKKRFEVKRVQIPKGEQD
jgi:hypothetical protein